MVIFIEAAYSAWMLARMRCQGWPSRIPRNFFFTRSKPGQLCEFQTQRFAPNIGSWYKWNIVALGKSSNLQDFWRVYWARINLARRSCRKMKFSVIIWRGLTSRWTLRVSFARSFERNVTKIAPHTALKLITRGKLT